MTPSPAHRIYQLSGTAPMIGDRGLDLTKPGTDGQGGLEAALCVGEYASSFPDRRYPHF